MKHQIQNDITLIVVLLVAVVFISGYALYGFEKNVNSDINSYWDGVWLAASSASSIGYGDIYPISLGGRVLASSLGFFGLILIGATGALFTRYLLRYKE